MSTEEHRPLESVLPYDARLCDPTDTTQRVKPTYDERGLLNIEKLVADVNATVDSGYKWPQDLNVHHFYWPDKIYLHQRTDDIYDNPALFVNLPIHKGLVPKAFHSWLHIISDPPKQPKRETIIQRNQAWVVIRDLFKMARETVVTQKQARRRSIYVANNPQVLNSEFNGVDIIGEEIMQEVLERNFRGFQIQLERQENIPKVHRIIDLDGTPAHIATQLGRLVVPKSLYLVNQIAA